jgi:hypothetical protein
MNSDFNIYQTGAEAERPPISFKVREYFEKFIAENVVSKKKIIVGGKWNISLAMHFSVDGPKVFFKGVALAKGARTVTSENVKIYETVILMEPIKESDNAFLKTIELMYEALKLFFTRTYKKITPGYMDELWKKVDVDYLLSLPYPAELSPKVCG